MSIHSPKQNQIPVTLSNEEYSRLLTFLEWVDMPLGQVICEPNAQIRFLYFPATCIIARVYELVSSISKQVSMVGNEAVIGMPLLLGYDSTPATDVVLSAGYGYRIKASVLRTEFESGGSLQQLLLRFSQALLLQTEHCVVAYGQTIEQQLCRFILMIQDRLPGDSLIMTHELVANMLGVRRESIPRLRKRFNPRGQFNIGAGISP